MHVRLCQAETSFSLKQPVQKFDRIEPFGLVYIKHQGISKVTGSTSVHAIAQTR